MQAEKVCNTLDEKGGELISVSKVVAEPVQVSITSYLFWAFAHCCH